MVVLVAYSAWVYPLEVAFVDAIPKRGLYIADNVVDFFFAIDIFLTFFVAYIDHRTQLLVRDSKKIARRSEFSIQIFRFPFSSWWVSNSGFWYEILWCIFWKVLLEIRMTSEMRSVCYGEFDKELDVHWLDIWKLLCVWLVSSKLF